MSRYQNHDSSSCEIKRIVTDNTAIVQREAEKSRSTVWRHLLLHKNGKIGPRHNRIQNTLIDYAKQGQLHVTKEDLSNDEDNKKMGDVVIHDYKNGRAGLFGLMYLL